MEVRINVIVGLKFCTIHPNKMKKKKKEKNNALTTSMHIPIQKHDGLSPYSTQ